MYQALTLVMITVVAKQEMNVSFQYHKTSGSGMV